VSNLQQCYLVRVSERDGLESSLAKFGKGVCFGCFANVLDSVGMGATILSFCTFSSYQHFYENSNAIF